MSSGSCIILEVHIYMSIRKSRWSTLFWLLFGLWRHCVLQRIIWMPPERMERRWNLPLWRLDQSFWYLNLAPPGTTAQR